MPSRLRIVLAGGLGALPFAGVGWQVLHHLEGLRRLGHRVLYLEDTGRWPYDPDADSLCSDARPAVRYLGALMRRGGPTATPPADGSTGSASERWRASSGRPTC